MSRFLSLCLLCACTLFFNRLSAQPCVSTDLAVQATGVAPASCGNCDGSAAALATGGTGPYTYLWSTGETTQGIGASQSGTALCINAGGGILNDSAGTPFTADQFFSGGTTFVNAIAIANTPDDALFQDERFVGNGGFFSYNIPVSNGNYLVELYFAEIFFGTSPTRPGGVGSRLFDVSIEGVLVLDDYDIFLDAGGPAIAIIKSFNANVTDGTLNILFDGVVNNAKINALCVTPVSSAGLCAGDYEVTVTDSNGCTATTSVTLADGACNDNNGCTTDACNNSQCVFTAITCDDGDSCTTDACDNGTCVFTGIPGCGDPCANILCDDEDPCTADTCDNGNCTFTAIPGCGDPCANILCDDGDACTADACANGLCVYTPLNCNDNDLCTTDSCLGTQCVYIPFDCDDGDACTLDECDGGACEHTPIPGCGDPCANVVCDDSDACTTDACDNGTCVYSALTCDDGDACTTNACDNGTCVYTALTCDDGDACTTNACDNGTCVYTALTCDDGDACTTDSCDNGTCVNLAIPGCSDPCDNLDCDDNDACTADGCMNAICTYTSSCDDGDLCTMDACHPDDDDDDGHYNDDDDDDGDDDDNGVGYHCHNRPVNCNDNDRCTTDECVNGVCVFTPKVCEDNDACTDNTCYRGNCKFREINCNDNDACTDDDCVGGICNNIPQDCEDGDLCTIDVCVAHWHGNRWNHWHTTCNHLDIVCEDNNACTDDECTAGNCTNAPVANCCLTDSDCGDNDLCTADKCLQNTCYNTSTALQVNALQNYCQNGTATLEPSEAGTAYAWSTGETSATIEGLPGTTYSVTVTLANGCVKTASITVAPREELLSSYVILAEEEIKLYRNTVYDGGIGVTDNHGDIRLKYQTKVIAPGTFAQADNIQLGSGSQVTVLNSSPADVTFPPFESNPYCNWNGYNTNVQQNQTITLSGSVYNMITVNKNATVTFTSTDLNIRNLYLKDNVTVNFANCTRVKICKELHIGEDNSFNPGGADVVVFVGNDVDVESGSTVFADIYSRNGLFEVEGSSSSDPTVLTGLFIAERVYAKDNAIWHADTTCDPACGTSQQLAAAPKMSEESVEEEMGQEVITDIAAGAYMKSYPNPFTDKLSIEFSLREDAEVKLEVYNLTGQLIATLFEGDVTSGAVQKVEFTPQTAAEGIYIYRLQTATETYIGKAVMAR